MNATPITPLCHGSYGRSSELRKFSTALNAGDALGDGKASAACRLPEGHQDACDDEGHEELKETASDARHEGNSGLCEISDLRLHAPDESRKIVVRLRPYRMHLLADHRPPGYRVGRGRDLELVALHVVDQPMYRVANRTHEYCGRSNDQYDPQNHNRASGKALPAADPRSEELLQRIESDGQDERPYHQCQERRKDAVAEHCQAENESGTDEDVEQSRGTLALEFQLTVGMRVHASLLGAGCAEFPLQPAR